MTWRRTILRLLEFVMPARRVQILEGDSLPLRMPRRDLVLAQEGNERWCVGMRCPCGCGDTLELLLIDEAKPRWDIKLDHLKRPTLHPSIWRTERCKAHFWVVQGRVRWCDP